MANKIIMNVKKTINFLRGKKSLILTKKSLNFFQEAKQIFHQLKNFYWLKNEKTKYVVGF